VHYTHPPVHQHTVCMVHCAIPLTRALHPPTSAPTHGVHGTLCTTHVHYTHPPVHQHTVCMVHCAPLTCAPPLTHAPPVHQHTVCMVHCALHMCTTTHKCTTPTHQCTNTMTCTRLIIRLAVLSKSIPCIKQVSFCSYK